MELKPASRKLLAIIARATLALNSRLQRNLRNTNVLHELTFPVRVH
jgi:hypothetical protein